MKTFFLNTLPDMEEYLSLLNSKYLYEIFTSSVEFVLTNCVKIPSSLKALFHVPWVLLYSFWWYLQ